MPKISVLLTSYNHSKYLREAIDSVLNQTFQDFELVIWDDASTDDSWSIITSYTDPRITPIRSESNSAGVGCISLMNRESIGDYIAILHSDDVWEPSKLAEQFSLLNSNPDVAAVFTYVTPIGENGEVFTDKKHFYFSIFDQPNRTRHGWLNRFFYVGNCLCHPSVLMRRTAFEESGGYHYGLVQLGDFDLWVRLCLKHDIYILPKRLTRFRIRENEANTSGDKPTTRIRWQFEFLRILENYRKIDDIDELLAVFPKAREYHSDRGFNVEFLLAMVAIHDGPWQFTKLFGLNLLYELLNKSDSASAIKAIYDFDSVKFIQLTGAHDIFSKERLARMESERAEQNQELTKRDAHLVNLNQELTKRDAHLANLNQMLAERDAHLANLNQTLADRDAHLANLNQTLADRDSNLASLNQALGERDHELASLTQALAELTSSHSWRLTRPLRFVGRLIRGNLKIEQSKVNEIKAENELLH